MGNYLADILLDDFWPKEVKFDCHRCRRHTTVSVYTPAGATTACTLRSVDKYGTSKDWHVVSFKAGSKAVNSDLAFGTSIGKSVDGGGYGMTCSLEPGAKIFTYRYTENSP